MTLDTGARARKPRSDRGRWGLLPVLLLACCTPTAPEVRVLASLPSGLDTPIYVTAPRDKEDVVAALRSAGFRIAEQASETDYLLRVTIGVEQKAQACGTLRNVRYDLRTAGRSIATAEAKGWTGRCEPNVFGDVSRALHARLVEARPEEKP